VEYAKATPTDLVIRITATNRGPESITFLIIEALQKLHHSYGDDFLVECPTGSGRKANAVADRVGNLIRVGIDVPAPA
jgi:hypothetical protein